MQPSIRWMKPTHKNKMNALEKLFIRFANHWRIQCRHESRFFYEDNPNRAKGDSLRGYCPDFYLPRYRVYVEVYEGEKIHANRSEIKKKRERIQWLSAYGNRTVVFIHLSNFPMDLEDFENLVKRARKEARQQRQEAQRTGKVYPLPHRHRSPGKNKSTSKAA